tara:strand:+ start:537 stop:1121 length:585 start_codon:yes stop_codon:yes gene_type:complete
MKTKEQPIEFTPIKLDVNFEAYTKAIEKGEAKINNFIEALEWCYKNYVDEKDFNDAAFNEDMMLEFQEAFLKKNSKLVRLDIGYEKLIDLLDVNLDTLKEFQYAHDENPIEIKILPNGDVAKVEINIEDYTTYTKNENENDMLEAASELMAALKKVERFSKVYPLTITQGVSNFLLFDMKQSQYRINRTLIPKA